MYVSKFSTGQNEKATLKHYKTLGSFSKPPFCVQIHSLINLSSNVCTKEANSPVTKRKRAWDRMSIAKHAL